MYCSFSSFISKWNDPVQICPQVCNSDHEVRDRGGNFFDIDYVAVSITFLFLSLLFSHHKSLYLL